jgi:hypothetical protein
MLRPSTLWQLDSGMRPYFQDLSSGHGSDYVSKTPEEPHVLTGSGA